MLNQIRLLALVPNQHTGLILQELRQSLYRETGCASALAFEPVIPLTSVSYVPEKHKVIRLLTPPETSAATVPTFSSKDFQISGGHIFLNTDQAPLIKGLQTALRTLDSVAPPVLLPFPLYPGLFFSQAEKSLLPPLSPPSEPIKWSSNRIGLYEFAFNAKKERWWDGIEWSLVWDFPFRIWKKDGPLAATRPG